MAVSGEYSSTTFRLEPKPEERFFPSQVKAIIQAVLEEKLSDATYSDELATTQSLEISEIVKSRCKQLRMPRFKIIVQTIVGEMLDQGVKVTSKCLWNTSFDNYASHTHIVNNVFAVVMVFGSYFE